MLIVGIGLICVSCYSPRGDQDIALAWGLSDADVAAASTCFDMQTADTGEEFRDQMANGLSVCVRHELSREQVDELLKRSLAGYTTSDSNSTSYHYAPSQLVTVYFDENGKAARATILGDRTITKNDQAP
jgi:hypothetical protein